ncbi:ParB N-terminal domain-containing protein [Undibacterium sp. Ji49W]|uniref:ParB N-terminal domain-containing protein n=1 Tax=Undibacterium sp. Ji49W TaxID=3413040 RepID=UPI003BF2C66F
MTSRTIEFKSIAKLLLDEENPRLPSTVQNSPQKQMLNFIARKGGIEDLMSAIGENGFFGGEALVVYQNAKDAAGYYRVIEGNRRLTAVKLLNDPSLCPTRPSIAALAAEAKHKPTELPVIIMASRVEVLPYLGSRHIVGVKQWEPLAKARYMNQLLGELTSKKMPIKERYRSIAESIGSHKRTDYIKSNLDALAVYKVIEENNFFNVENLNEESIDFGTLYTALPYDGIGEFVGASKYIGKTQTYDSTNPILNQNLLNKKNIAKLTKWFFEKNEDGETILGESRNISKFNQVLKSPEALRQLEQGATLDTAYSFTQGTNNEFVEFMQKAKSHLQSASSIMANTTPDKGNLKLAEQVFELAKTVRAVMQTKQNSSDD